MFKKQYSKFSSVCSLLLFQMLCVTAIAQNKSNETNTYMLKLWGHLRDGFTKASIPNVKITLMNEDSVVLDSTITFDVTNGNGIYDATYSFNVPAVPSKFIIKASHKDYEDCFVNFDMKYVKRHSYFDAKWHIMKRIARQESSMDRWLDEVVVKGSKVRFVYKGDTLIYNADAFNVPKGSMLDGLLRQMDGVEIDSDGNITVKGRHVDYLTLNGKDFFKGKNKIMLDNLPYYTVQNIKVFYKSSDRSEVLGRDVDKRDYVMNVQLKREYRKGYIDNAETESQETEFDRYLARAFGLGFSERNRFMIYGNTNNVSKAGYVGSQGTWYDNDLSSRSDFLNGGLNFMHDSKDGKIEEELSAILRSINTDDLSKTLTETYLDKGSYDENAFSKTDDNHKMLSVENHFKRKNTELTFPVQLTSRFYLDYNQSDKNEDYHSMQRKISYLSNDMVIDTLNDVNTKSVYSDKELEATLQNHLTIKAPWGDHMDFSLLGKYKKYKNDLYAYNRYQYYETPENNEFRNRYDQKSSNNYNICGNADYSFDWPCGWSIELGTTYNFEYNNDTDNKYRLDYLGGIYSDISPSDWHAMLPSNRDSLLMALDASNSLSYTTKENKMTTYCMLTYSKNTSGKYTRYNVGVYPIFANRNIDYDNSGNNFNFHDNRKLLNFAANYEIGIDNMKKHLTINAKRTQTLPDMYNMINVKNSSNPLVEKCGNSNLNPYSDMVLSIDYQYRGKHDYNSSLSLSYKGTSNAIVQTFTITNSLTGARLYKPENINGNWQANMNYTTGVALDSMKLMHLNISLAYGFYHSVDMIGVEGYDSSVRSTVLSHVASINPKLNYSKNALSLSLLANLKWRGTHSQESYTYDSSPVNVFDFNYGLSSVYSFKSGLNLSTDIMMSSRRGYSNINSDELVWNAQISAPLYKNCCTIKFVCLDILGKKSQYDYTINSQGRTEVWKNTLGRVGMISLIWKFNNNPDRIAK